MGKLLFFGLGVLAAKVLKDTGPAFWAAGRPLLKATVKSGLILAREGRVRIEEFRETLADVTAEAREELAHEEVEVPPTQTLTPEKQEAAGVM